MSSEPTICVVCAWRKDCLKKFSMGKDIKLRCPDFTRDLTIKESEKSFDTKKDNGSDKGGC